MNGDCLHKAGRQIGEQGRGTVGVAVVRGREHCHEDPYGEEY